MARIILGLAPGRCGSASLATLLGRQTGVWATHTCPVYPVSADPPEDLADLAHRAKAGGAHTAAAVGPQWLNQAAAAMEQDARTLALVLWRTPSQIVQSMRDTGWWGELAERGTQDVPGKSPSEYVANYYLGCMSLMSRYPVRVRVVDCDGLGSECHNRKLLAWCVLEATDARGVRVNDGPSCCARKAARDAAA